MRILSSPEYDYNGAEGAKVAGTELAVAAVVELLPVPLLV